MERYAILFPQFHQVNINDSAWGYGFTDWSLVATANAFDLWPRRVPVAGFYDLANPIHIKERFEDAANSGLDGFGIYHYRFDDGSELDAVERYLRKSEPPKDFNYFFIWANESWSKRWAGKDTEILKSVSPSPTLEQIREHVSYLAPYLASNSYTKINGRPMFVIYRPEFFLDIDYVVSTYRTEFELLGLNPFIGYSLKNASDIIYSKYFEFCYLFEPRLFFNFYGVRRNSVISLLYRFIVRILPYDVVERLSELTSKVINRKSKSFQFEKYFKYFTSTERQTFVRSLSCPVQNILTSGWNNAPRYRDNSVEIETPTSEQFTEMVKYSLSNESVSDNLPLLCNAWNEWSEGAAIEPCRYMGDGLLKAFVSQKL